MIAPFVRIFLRYAVGLVAGWSVGDMLAGDPDVVDALAAGVSVVMAVITERWYKHAKSTGGAT